MTNARTAAPTIITSTFHFDPAYHWTWMDQVRDVLTHPDDQEMFTLCGDRGAHLFPWALHAYMNETLTYASDALQNPREWAAAMDLVEAHAQHPQANQFEMFAAPIDHYLATIGSPWHEAPIVDVCRTDTADTWTTSEFSLAQIFCVIDSTTVLSSMTFSHDGESALSTLTVHGPELETTLELHFPADPMRDALARHHYETVLYGEEAVVKHLNSSAHAHCEALTVLVGAHPRADIWDLEELNRNQSDSDAAA